MDFKYYTYIEYEKAGCMQTEVALGVALHRHTGGKMCKGCPKYNGGNCESLRKMSKSGNKATSFPAGETVREEALRRGLGIKEIRRQRNV